MNSFDFHSPKTLDEAYELLDRHKEDYAVVAGGTDILIELKPELEQYISHKQAEID